MQRRRDVIDDSLAEVIEENVENLFEPPEVLPGSYMHALGFSLRFS